MPLPKAIQAQAERASNLQDELDGKTAPQGGQAPEGQQQRKPESSPMPADLPPLTLPSDEGANQQDTPAGQEPQPQRQEGQSQTPDIEKLQQSLRVLQGKYDNEVPELHRINKELRENNEKLLSLVEDFKSGKGDNPQVSASQAVSVLTDELGEDVVKALDSLLSGKLSDVSSRLDKLTQTTSKTLEQRYWENIKRSHSDWQAVNNDPEFLAWLDSPAPFSGGRTYRDLMADAHAGFDHQTIIEIFDTFKDGKGKGTPRGQQSEQNEQPLDISPGRGAGGGGGGATPNANRRFWTRAEVAQVYDAARHGRLTPEQLEAYENEFDAATREGRIERA